MNETARLRGGHKKEEVMHLNKRMLLASIAAGVVGCVTEFAETPTMTVRAKWNVPVVVESKLMGMRLLLN